MMAYKHGVALDPKLNIEDYNAGVRVRNDSPLLHVDIIYPRSEGQRITGVSIGLECVRAAMGITVTYDFDRDGWKIAQMVCVGYGPHPTIPDCGTSIEEEREVSFIPAWHPDEVDLE
jgi:hypothetical protein